MFSFLRMICFVCLLVIEVNFNSKALAAASEMEQAQKADLINVENTDFPFKFFEKMLLSNQQNILISPFSIQLAFIPLYPGAGDKLKKEFQTVFGFPVEVESALKNFSILSNSFVMHNDKNKQIFVDLSLHLWSEQTASILPSYAEILKNNLNLQIEVLDFKTKLQNSVDTINKVVQKDTHGMVKKLLSVNMVKPDTVFASVSAISFKDKWKYKFAKQKIKPGVFHTKAKGAQKTKFMHLNEYLQTAVWEGCDVVSLPYEYSQFEMLWIVPAEVNAYQECSLIKDFSSFTNLLSSLKSAKIKLSIPKFEINNDSIDVLPVLSDMGIKNVKDIDAMYAYIKPKIYLAVQKAYFKVAEEGTSAAAATAVLAIPFDKLSGQAGSAKTITVNRPSQFFLYHKQSKAILFIGRLDDVKSASFK